MKPDYKDTIILTGIVGSVSYGTATPLSDLDYMSLVIPSVDFYYGLDDWGNSGTMEDVSDDSTTGVLVEHKYFEIRKAIELFLKFNPNVIPLLWLDLQCYASMTEEGALLILNRALFNSKRVYHTFSGYAHSQLQKMGGLFNDAEDSNKLLKAGYARFSDEANDTILTLRAFRDAKSSQYQEGYLNAMIALRSHAQEEIKRIKDGPITGRMGAKRKAIREKYGYDCRFLMHTIRLMKMCVEFLKHPEEGLKVNRAGIDADFLYSIREGALTQEQGKALADELFNEAREALKASPLPDEPDRTAVHSLTMDLIRLRLGHRQ